MPDWMTTVFPDLPLLGLFVYSVLAATLLPGGSEVALFAYVANTPQAMWLALLVATLGNTLGGLTSYLCGRFLPGHAKLEEFRRSHHIGRLERYGAPLLLLSWTPILGDLLCLAAGWLRLNWLACMFFMAIGKLVRYWIVAQGALLL